MVFFRAVENFGNKNTYIKSSLKIKPKLKLEFIFFYFPEATHSFVKISYVCSFIQNF